MKNLLIIAFTLCAVKIMALEDSLSRDYCSKDFRSFSSCFKRDSVLSLKSAKGFLPSTIYDLGRQATFPLRMNENQWLLLMGFSGLTATLIHYDKNVDDRVKTIKDKSSFIARVSPQFTDIGDVYGYLFLTGVGGYSIAFHNYRLFRVSLTAAQSAITAGLWIRAMKTLTGRMRPGQLYGDFEFREDHWFGPFAQFKSRYNTGRGIGAFDAFPSGHTGAAFAIATVFARQYADLKAVPVTAYSLATLVGFTRLIEHEHWMSDVVVGGLIGYLCGRQVVIHENNLFGKESLSWKNSKSFFFPVYENSFAGLKWSLIF